MQSVSRAVQHVGNVVLLASGPLRKPAADVTQGLQLVLLSPAIRHPPPPSLPSHVLGTRIARDGPSPLFTFHAHARTEHSRDLDPHMHTRLRRWLISLGGGGDITSIETER